MRDKQLYLREDVAWTDAGHQRLEKKIAEDSVDEEQRRCQHAADPPRVLRNTSSSAVSVTQRIPESPRRVIKPMLPSSMGLCRDCRAVRKVSSAFIRLPLSRFVVYRIPEVYEQKAQSLKTVVKTVSPAAEFCSISVPGVPDGQGKN